MPLPESVPTVAVLLDRPRRLALTLGAMRRIKEEVGVSVADLEQMPESERFDHIHQLVWALLVNEDREDLTAADLEEMLHAGNLEAVVNGFLDVVYGPATKGAEGNGVPAPLAVRAGKRPRPPRRS